MTRIAATLLSLLFDSRGLAVVPGSEPAEDVPKVEARMRGPEVLDVDRHPGILFASSSIAVEAREPGRYRLRLRGTPPAAAGP